MTTTIMTEEKSGQTFLERIGVEARTPRTHITPKTALPCKGKSVQLVDAEYEQWKRENGLDVPMTESKSRAYYCDTFNIYG